MASVRYLGAVHFKAQAFTGSEEDANQLVDGSTPISIIFRTAESTVSTPGPDPDIKAFFDSLKIQPEKTRAVLTATVPLGLIRKALAEAPASVTPEPQPPQSPHLLQNQAKAKKESELRSARSIWALGAPSPGAALRDTSAYDCVAQPFRLRRVQ